MPNQIFTDSLRCELNIGKAKYSVVWTKIKLLVSFLSLAFSDVPSNLGRVWLDCTAEPFLTRLYGVVLVFLDICCCSKLFGYPSLKVTSLVAIKLLRKSIINNKVVSIGVCNGFLIAT